MNTFMPIREITLKIKKFPTKKMPGLGSFAGAFHALLHLAQIQAPT